MPSATPERAPRATDSAGISPRCAAVSSAGAPSPAKSFAAVLLLGNSFGYFAEPDDDMRVLSEVRRILKSEGHILLDISSGHYLRTHFDPRSWEWLDDHHLLCRERELATDDRRLVSREVLIHVERGVLHDQFYAERIYDRRQITEALSTAGFTDIRFGRFRRPDPNEIRIWA